MIPQVFVALADRGLAGGRVRLLRVARLAVLLRRVTLLGRVGVALLGVRLLAVLLLVARVGVGVALLGRLLLPYAGGGVGCPYGGGDGCPYAEGSPYGPGWAWPGCCPYGFAEPALPG